MGEKERGYQLYCSRQICKRGRGEARREKDRETHRHTHTRTHTHGCGLYISGGEF